MSSSWETRESDAPLVEYLWRARNEEAGDFTSKAETHWEMVIARHRDKTQVFMRGPETKATPAAHPPDTEIFGIVFKLGSFMPDVPVVALRDRQDRLLPEAGSRSVWLLGSAWEIPNFENVDSFIAKLMRNELLVRDPLVYDVMQGQPQDLSPRAVQYRFQRATGLSQNAIYQIERAQQAVALLEKGVSILDTVYETGYADQPHLTRMLKRLMGRTPAQIIQARSLAGPWAAASGTLVNTVKSLESS